MRVTVTVPQDKAADYLRLIADQLDEGYTSGHWSADTHWRTEEEPPPRYNKTHRRAAEQRAAATIPALAEQLAVGDVFSVTLNSWYYRVIDTPVPKQDRPHPHGGHLIWVPVESLRAGSNRTWMWLREGQEVRRRNDENQG
jgi:hypothetical protein